MLPWCDRCTVPAGAVPILKDGAFVLWASRRCGQGGDRLSWDFVGVIYPKGAGYSAIHVLPYDGIGNRLGVAFQRMLYDPNLEGGGYNMAWASMTIV